MAYDFEKRKVSKFGGFYFWTRVVKKTQAKEKTLKQIILRMRAISSFATHYDERHLHLY